MNTKKNWVMIVENNIDAIQKAIEEAYIEMHERSSGWRIEISIDEDGEVQSSCLLSQNTKVHYDAVDCVCLHDVESWRYIDICDNIEEFEQADEETKNEMVREYVESAEFGVMDMIDRAIENLK